jgi:hypothetical protein
MQHTAHARVFYIQHSVVLSKASMLMLDIKKIDFIVRIYETHKLSGQKAEINRG